MKMAMRMNVRLPVALLGLTMMTGCQAMYFLTPEQEKEVKAEYGKITTERVAVVVWADQTTIDIDPRARRRVADAVLYDMKKYLPDAKFVPAKEVEEFQDSSGLDWESMTATELAKEFKCDFILRIDLSEYTTRAADTRELRKARVRGTVNLYEAGDARDQSSYSTEITSTFPAEAGIGLTDRDDADLLREATSQFGQMVSRKFHDHKVSMRGRDAK